MTQIERLIYLRKKVLKLTQKDFAEKIGLKRSSLSVIEAGYVNLTERNIEFICSMFNVNKKWLESGEGEIFVELSEDEKLAAWMGKIMNDKRKEASARRIISILKEFDDEDWENLEKITKKFIEIYNNKKNCFSNKMLANSFFM